MQDPVIEEIRRRIERIELSAGIPRKPWIAEPVEKPQRQAEPEQERRGPGRPRKVAEG